MAMMSPGTGSSERPGGSALSEINITPFVDVVLVLLVIFLITAPMMLRGIDVKVPKTEAKNVGPEERLMLTVTKEKAIYLDNQPITLGRLEGVLSGFDSATRRPRYSFGRMKEWPMALSSR